MRYLSQLLEATLMPLLVDVDVWYCMLNMVNGLLQQYDVRACLQDQPLLFRVWQGDKHVASVVDRTFHTSGSAF